jgi:hypothetical protein
VRLADLGRFEAAAPVKDCLLTDPGASKVGSSLRRTA